MKANSSSNTAVLIARSLVLASHERELASFVSPETVKALNNIFPQLWCFRCLRFAPVRFLLLKLEGVFLPGIIAHYLARKAYIEAAVRRAIEKGCRRVVVLGAGYDPLAWRLHRENPEVSFVELDHPATQTRKKDRLGGGRNLTYQALDLGESLPSACLEKDKGSTVFVVEGLTMYLTGERVREILSDLMKLAGEAGEVIWSFMEKDENGAIGFRRESSWVGRWLSWRKEPFRWGLKRSELEEFASSCGMRVTGLADHEQLKKRAPEGRVLAEGELICCGVPNFQKTR